MDDDWVSTTGTVLESDAIDLTWLQQIFPTRELTKLEAWTKILRDNEFETVSDLVNLDDEGWASLPLPLAIKGGLKRTVKETTSQPNLDFDTGPLSPNDVTINIHPVSQIDCIVIDISASMRSRSKVDVDKTREDVSKMLFHTMVDKLISLELYHGVGLLAFGEHIVPIGITREYERFHDELGRLDACQGRTKLYDSIKAAAEMVEDYSLQHCPRLDTNGTPAIKPPMKRVFVLTDGEDNASTEEPWRVAQYVQQRGIRVDAIPLAGPNLILQSICTASGGLCFDIVSQEQGMALFEGEATLHLPYREEVEMAPAVVDAASLKQLEKAMGTPSVDIRSAPSATFASPSMSTPNAILAAQSVTATHSSAAVRRIMREYADIMNAPEQVPGCSVFVSEGNYSGWKAVLSDLPFPYEGGVWLLTLDFPHDYPFKPPRVRFSTPVYHCNISNDGHICLDVLKDTWSPALSARSILTSIRTLMQHCNADDPLDAFKGQLCRDDRPTYEREARKHTSTHASASFEEICARHGLS